MENQHYHIQLDEGGVHTYLPLFLKKKGLNVIQSDVQPHGPSEFIIDGMKSTYNEIVAVFTELGFEPIEEDFSEASESTQQAVA